MRLQLLHLVSKIALLCLEVIDDTAGVDDLGTCVLVLLDLCVQLLVQTLDLALERGGERSG